MSTSSTRQADVNTETWTRRNFLRAYQTDTLRPVEAVMLERYRAQLDGEVLELGCGAGRLTGHLIRAAKSVRGLDISERMIEHCARTYPGAAFSIGDLRNLTTFDDGSFAAVIATCNVLDVLDDFERVGVLDEIHRLLAPDGLLIFSSHNRASEKRVPSPMHVDRYSLPGTLKSALFTPRRILNHRRLAPLERDEQRYAIVNDEAHGFALLHYYITRDMQAKQLVEREFELIECLDLDGKLVVSGEAAAHCPELHYVARRATSVSTGERWRPRFASAKPPRERSDVRVP